MYEVPIIRVGTYLIVSVQEDLDDESAQHMEERVAQHVAKQSTKGVLLDVSGLNVMDSFIARILDRMVGLVGWLGAEAVVVGIQPAVAMTLVELGLDLVNVPTALDTERGLRLLQSGSRSNTGDASAG